MTQKEGFTPARAAGVGAACVLILIAIFSNKIEKTEPAPTPSPTHAAAIASGATDPWEPEKYPRMVNRLGLSVFKHSVRLFPEAAKRSSENRSCDMVAYVGIQERSTSDDVGIFVNCENGAQQFYAARELYWGSPAY